MDELAVWIAISALLFTILSFWWLNARKGQIRGHQPAAYTAAVAQDQVFLLRLPLTFYNSGARTRVIHGIRLVIDTDSPTVLRWEHLSKHLHSEEDDFLDFPGPLAIDGRRALQIFPQFTGHFAGGLPEPRNYTARVEILLDNSEKWTCTATIILRFWHIHTLKFETTYSNSREECEPNEKERARAKMIAFAAKNGISLGWHTN